NQPDEIVTVNEGGGNGGGGSSGGKGDGKSPKLSEAQKLQAELEKINDDIFLNALESSDKEVEAMRLKYEKLRTQAKGNKDQLAEIDRLEGVESEFLIEKITKKTEEEAKKQYEAKAKAMQEINQKLMTESQLEIDTAKNTYLRLLE